MRQSQAVIQAQQCDRTQHNPASHQPAHIRPATNGAGDGDFWGEASAAAAAAPASGAEFSDAVAIQLPAQLPTGIRKPYFLFGDAQNPVDLWFVDLGLKVARATRAGSQWRRSKARTSPRSPARTASGR
jgi:hypothetical protein